MYELENIMKQIEKLREKMNNLLKKKGSLLDPEVIAASQILDSVLNEYYKILRKKIDKH